MSDVLRDPQALNHADAMSHAVPFRAYQLCCAALSAGIKIKGKITKATGIFRTQRNSSTRH
jgi:hypothetical protein